jgi:hypothetical protein
MTLDPAVHCSRVRKLAVGIVNEKLHHLPISSFTALSHARCFLA